MSENLTPRDEIKQLCACFELNDDKLVQLMDIFLENIQLGLGKDTHDSAVVKCFVTYIYGVPSIPESKKFLAIDLGGVNFRVLVINVSNRQYDMWSKVYPFPRKLMTGDETEMFDHIVDSLCAFMKLHNIEKEALPLGFIFSFPLIHDATGVSGGVLHRWTKGFSCANVIGKNVGQLLADAITRRGELNVKVQAVLNDTTGTLLSCGWKRKNTKIGVIYGKGFNCCYMEKLENVQCFQGESSEPHIAINTECGALGENGQLDFIRNDFDKKIDESSFNPGQQILEKMISGMYLGELVRLVLDHATKSNVLLGGKGSEKLFEQGHFFSKYVSEIENDPSGTYINTRQVMSELGLSHATNQDCEDIRYVCEAVCTRSANLVAACIATLLKKMEFPSVNIGMDGSVYRFHSHLQETMLSKLKDLTPDVNVTLMLSEDGSGLGGALAAEIGSQTG